MAIPIESVGLVLAALAPLTVIVYNFIDFSLPHRNKKRERKLEQARDDVRSADVINPNEDSYDIFCELISEYEHKEIQPTKFTIGYGGFGGGAPGLHYESEEENGFVASRGLVTGWIESELKEIQRKEERVVLLIASLFLLTGICLQLLSSIQI